tara:strand:- start:125 stop:610 length:486 start_codon:yes stop_codon:yes gene_type:complete
MQHEVEAHGLLLRVDPQANNPINELEQDITHDRRISERRHNPGGLHRQLTADGTDALGETVAAEYTQVGRTENTCEQRTQNATHPVDREYIEAVVNFQPVLQGEGRVITDNSGTQANDHRSGRADRTRGRRDSAEARHHTGDDTQHRRLAVADPLHGHPRQ